MKFMPLFFNLLGVASASRDQALSPTDPIPLNTVVDSVSRYLRNDGVNDPSFVIIGSYPAAVRAMEHGISIPYNDIDVSVEASSKPSDKCAAGNFLSSSFVENVIPGSDVLVNFRFVCSIEDVARSLSDINSSSIAIVANHAASIGHDTEAEIKLEWVEFPEFADFINSETLKINEGAYDALGESLVRLVRKGQQLGLPYELPKDDIHGMAILPIYKEHLSHLDEEHKDVFYDKYDLIPIHDGKGYMFVGKERELPRPPSLESLRRSPSSPSKEDCKSGEPIDGHCCTHFARYCDDGDNSCWTNYSKENCEEAHGEYIKCTSVYRGRCEK